MHRHEVGARVLPCNVPPHIEFQLSVALDDVYVHSIVDVFGGLEERLRAAREASLAVELDAGVQKAKEMGPVPKFSLHGTIERIGPTSILLGKHFQRI